MKLKLAGYQNKAGLLIIGLVMGCFGASNLSGADDPLQALYGTDYSVNGGLLRVLNSSPESIPVVTNFQAEPWPLASQSLSSYKPLQEGTYMISAATQKLTFELPARTAKTLVYTTSGWLELTVNQGIALDPGKCVVHFINLTTQPLSLKTSDGDITVFQSAAPNTLVSRKVNEVRIVLAAFNGDKKVWDYPVMYLQRSNSITYWVGEHESSIWGGVIPDVVRKVIKNNKVHD